MSSSYRESEKRTVSLTHQAHGLRQTFTVTAAHFVVEWESAEGKGRSEHPLRDVSSEVAYFEGKAAGDPAALGRALLAAGLAAVVYFSTIQQHVPLLAPFLLLVAAVFGYRANRAAGRSRWSVISHKDGRQLATIDHSGCDEKQLEELLHVLRERAASERHVGAVETSPGAD